MAAPSPTTRGTPAGRKLPEGWNSKITPASLPTISLWEIEVTPPERDGGPRIKTTTMHNTGVHTYEPQSLQDLKEWTVRAAYDPNVRNQIKTMINVKDTYTIKYWDGSTEAMYAYLQKMTPQAIKIGDMPVADFTFAPTNVDSSLAEQDYVVASVAGT